MRVNGYAYIAILLYIYNIYLLIHSNALRPFCVRQKNFSPNNFKQFCHLCADMKLIHIIERADGVIIKWNEKKKSLYIHTHTRKSNTWLEFSSSFSSSCWTEILHEERTPHTINIFTKRVARYLPRSFSSFRRRHSYRGVILQIYLYIKILCFLHIHTHLSRRTLLLLFTRNDVKTDAFA